MAEAKNPYAALLGKKRLRAPGDLNALRRRLWYALSMTMAGLDDAARQDDPEAIQKWLHCLSQLSGTYIKCTLEGDIEARLKQLEAVMAQSQGSGTSGPYTPVRRK